MPLRFNRDIRPILSDNCFGCHGTDAHDAKAGLQLHSFEAATAPLGKGKDRQALVPGDRGASELWKRVSAKDPEEIMPPPDSNHRLSLEQIELLGRWIDQGGEYERSLVIPNGGCPKGSLDRFIDPCAVRGEWLAACSAGEPGNFVAPAHSRPNRIAPRRLRRLMLS